MADFIIEELSRDQIRSVYPLVREAFPPLDLSTWLRFARQLTGPHRGPQYGIVAARREGRAFPCSIRRRYSRQWWKSSTVWRSDWAVTRCAASCMAARPTLRVGCARQGTGRSARRCC